MIPCISWLRNPFINNYIKFIFSYSSSLLILYFFINIIIYLKYKVLNYNINTSIYIFYLIMKTKIVENWHFPPDEKSVFRKVKSSRDKIGSQFSIDDYQVQLRDAALKYTTNFSGVVDVGAHIGIWSVHFSKVFKQVYAFEINPDTLPSLEANIASRDIKNVKIFTHGLGDKEQLVEICPTRFKSMGTYITAVDTGTNLVLPLDSFNLKDIGLIKIDVEGFESAVLLGAAETIIRCKPIIVMEDKPDLHTRFGGPTPSNILLDLGLKEIVRFRKDVIFG